MITSTAVPNAIVGIAHRFSERLTSYGRASKITIQRVAIGLGEDSGRPAGQSEQENRGELRVTHRAG